MSIPSLRDLFKSFFAKPEKEPPTPAYSGPMRKAPLYYIGETFTRPDVERHANGAPYGKRNKPARRALRKLAKRGRIDVQIVRARKQRLEDESLATNAHEARRYHERLRNLRRLKRETDALEASLRQKGAL